MADTYYYMRSGILHKKYTVDEALQLSPTEEERIKQELAQGKERKQDIFANTWDLYTKTIGRKPFVFHDWFNQKCENKRKRMESIGR